MLISTGAAAAQARQLSAGQQREERSSSSPKQGQPCSQPVQPARGRRAHLQLCAQLLGAVPLPQPALIKGDGAGALQRLAVQQPGGEAGVGLGRAGQVS